MDANPLDPAVQNDRAQVLCDLARLDGRLDTSHPHHGTFTGLGRPSTRLMAAEAKISDLERQIEDIQAKIASADEA